MRQPDRQADYRELRWSRRQRLSCGLCNPTNTGRVFEVISLASAVVSHHRKTSQRDRRMERKPRRRRTSI